MTISSLALVNFRNITNARLNLSPHLNVISGDNGAGKTSLLEALYYALTGKSFRTRSQADYINRYSDDGLPTQLKINMSCPLLVDGHDIHSVTVTLGTANKPRINSFNDGSKRIDRFSSFTQRTPCFYFSPEALDFLSGEPQGRRSFLDWCLFHVEPSYRDLHLRFRHILKQRNSILNRIKSIRNVGARSDIDLLKSQLCYWTNEYVSVNNDIHSLRLIHLPDIFRKVGNIVQCDFGLDSLNLNVAYHQGWKSEKDLLSVVEEQQDSELALGYSLSGVHKADILVTGTDGVKGKYLFSRGQTKLVTLAFILSAVQHIKSITHRNVILLLDDIFSELDRLNSGKVSDIIAQLVEHQILLTSAERSLSFTDIHMGPDRHQLKMFHVKHGEVIEEN